MKRKYYITFKKTKQKQTLENHWEHWAGYLSVSACFPFIWLTHWKLRSSWVRQSLFALMSPPHWPAVRPQEDHLNFLIQTTVSHGVAVRILKKWNMWSTFTPQRGGIINYLPPFLQQTLATSENSGFPTAAVSSFPLLTWPIKPLLFFSL
jgi:hypothetical protein